MRYFYQNKVGCTLLSAHIYRSYELEKAKNLDEAKATAIVWMEVNDILCECEDDVDPREESAMGCYINTSKCVRAYALEEGVWMLDEDGNEYYNNTAYTWAVFSKQRNRFVSSPDNVWFDARRNVIDSNKLANYIAKREMMCASFDSCSDCPLYTFNIPHIPCRTIFQSGSCKIFEKVYPFEARSIIKKWDDANQPKTHSRNFFEKLRTFLRSFRMRLSRKENHCEI